MDPSCSHLRCFFRFLNSANYYCKIRLKYQNLPLGIIQTVCIIAIDVILQNIKRNGPVGTYFTHETTEVPKLALGDVQVSDECRQYIWFFFLTSNRNVLVHNTHTKSFEVPKLALGNNLKF